MTEYFRIGVITTTHGLQGEVKVFPTTEDMQRFKKLKRVFLETAAGYRELEVENVKFFKNIVIVKFKGLDKIEDVQRFHQLSLYVAREDAIALEPGEYYVADLLGLKVLNEDGSDYGVLKDILQTAANDVYVIERNSDHKEILLPGIPDCLLERNPQEGFIRIHILPGLEDL